MSHPNSSQTFLNECLAHQLSSASYRFCKMVLQHNNVSPQRLTMAKELPSTNAPPDIFHLFNENRTFYFESDISSLPNPSSTMPEPPPSHSSRHTLHKSFSQPQLTITDSLVSLSEASHIPHPDQTELKKPSPGDLHVSTAVMASLTSKQPHHDSVHRYDSTKSAGDHSSISVKDRYQTEPTFGSSRILKSFKTEFGIFGKHVQSQDQRQSVSNPASPRGGSSPDVRLAVDEDRRQRAGSDPRQRVDSDPRKLSLVKEEESRSLDLAEESSGEVAVIKARDTGAKSGSGPLKEAVPVGVTKVDNSSLAQHGSSKLPLTKKVMDWLTSPSAHAGGKIQRTQTNAISPQSF